MSKRPVDFIFPDMYKLKQAGKCPYACNASITKCRDSPLNSKNKMQADSNSQPHRVAGSPEEATSESERIGSRQTASQCVDSIKEEKK